MDANTRKTAQEIAALDEPVRNRLFQILGELSEYGRQFVLGSEPEATDEPQTMSELAKVARENPLRWLIPYTLIEGGIHVFYGKEESFKTMLTLQMLETLSIGGRFLRFDVKGGLRVGMVELEMTKAIFGERCAAFLDAARSESDIKILTEKERVGILNSRSPRERVKRIAEWAAKHELQVIVIDSLAKLFPEGSNMNDTATASDMFSQFQQAGCTVVIIGHSRKRAPQNDGNTDPDDDDELSNSARFVQDPDLVLRIRRPDKRAPHVIFSWRKNRMKDKPADLNLYFDRVAFRLFPTHPFLHLLPASRQDLLELAESRYGWKRSRVDQAIFELKNLQDEDEQPLIEEVVQHKRAVFRQASNRPL